MHSLKSYQWSIITSGVLIIIIIIIISGVLKDALSSRVDGFSLTGPSQKLKNNNNKKKTEERSVSNGFDH